VSKTSYQQRKERFTTDSEIEIKASYPKIEVADEAPGKFPLPEGCRMICTVQSYGRCGSMPDLARLKRQMKGITTC
jgi:hypothetical protein